MTIFALISILMVAGAIVFGISFTTRLFQRLDQIESGRHFGGHTGDLTDEVERLRVEVGDLQTEIQRLEERLDFTEKLLGSGDDDTV